MWRCGVNPRTSEARLRPTGSRRKNRIFREVLYAPRFRPISEIGRRPGRGGYNYAQAGGANFRSSGHRPDLYSTAELILRPGWIDTLPRGPPGDSDASRDSAVALSVGENLCQPMKAKRRALGLVRGMSVGVTKIRALPRGALPTSCRASSLLASWLEGGEDARNRQSVS